MNDTRGHKAGQACCCLHRDLREAIGEECDIRDSGLWARYQSDVAYWRGRMTPPKHTGGPLSRTHGDRWQNEYRVSMREWDSLIWQIGSDFSAEHNTTIDSAMVEAKRYIDDHVTRCRKRWAVVARLLLAGVAIDLPEIGGESAEPIAPPINPSGDPPQVFSTPAPIAPPLEISIETVVHGGASK